MSIAWAAKDPDEVLDYGVDWTERLDGDTIATSAISLVTAAGLTIGSQSNTTTASSVWLSGGTAGETAELLCRITTAAGRTMDEEITLAIVATDETNSEFYGSTAGFRAFADKRGLSYAGKTAEQMRQALYRASEYVDSAYRSQFPGVKTGGRAQVREWPRAGAVDREGLGIDSDEAPDEIENATYEGAIRELASPGSLSPDIKAGGGVVSRVKAGSVEVEFATDGSLVKTFQAIERALGSLLVMRSRYSGTTARA